MKPKHETCRHVVSIGAVAVYVTPDCPNYHKVKGQLVTTKRCCQVCDHWRRRNEKKNVYKPERRESSIAADV